MGATKLVWTDPWRHGILGLRAGQASRIDGATELFSQQRYAEAAVLLERLHTERPDDATILINLGTAYRILGKLDKSIQASQDALAVNPDHYAAHFELARAYAEKSGSSGLSAISVIGEGMDQLGKDSH